SSPYLSPETLWLLLGVTARSRVPDAPEAAIWRQNPRRDPREADSHYGTRRREDDAWSTPALCRCTQQLLAWSSCRHSKCVNRRASFLNRLRESASADFSVGKSRDS